MQLARASGGTVRTLALLWLAGPACGSPATEAAEPEDDQALGADGRSDLAATGGRFDADQLPGRPGRPARPAAAAERREDPRTGLPLVVVPPRPGLPAAGPADAPLQVVVFTDFQCPYCREHAADLRRLAEHYGDRLRLTVRMLPLAFHELARPAAEAALAAHAAGKFWPFHDRLMDLAPDELSLERIRRTAAELGLDLGRSEDGLTGGAAANAVDRDLADARAAGIDATPTTLINGRLFSGMVGLERLVEICEQLLGATR